MLLSLNKSRFNMLVFLYSKNKCFLFSVCVFFRQKEKKEHFAEKSREMREKKLVHFFAVEREGKNLHTQSF